MEKRFKKFIKVNNLREVVFHSLRHSSATYKLKLSKGDIKATQGDTGHKSADMITKRYAHIIDEDRKVNATKFEDEFYASKENEEKDDASELVDILKNNDALREQLKKCYLYKWTTGPFFSLNLRLNYYKIIKNKGFPNNGCHK
ncbi:MAG: hypothetical protein ACLVBF_14880 [Faecalibacillus intestinalis]|uniref:hypothetical protein n=1 Tax=Faecalibacillus intestinalis TaxID=1982626 RepID=UPI00399A8BC4